MNEQEIQKLLAKVAEVIGEHTPRYDYRNGMYLMECDACDFMLGGLDRADAKRRFGEHFAGVLAPLLSAERDALAAEVAKLRAALGDVDRLSWGWAVNGPEAWARKQVRAVLDRHGVTAQPDTEEGSDGH